MSDIRYFWDLPKRLHPITQ